MMSGNMAEVNLGLFALKLTALHQLIHFASQGFVMKGAQQEKLSQNGSRQDTKTDQWDKREKLCSYLSQHSFW